MKSKSNALLYILVSLAAIIIFIGTYGTSVLDPVNIDLWYLKGDWTQHYFGWVGFRDSNWQFPLGMYDNNTYPDSVSIIFTDSIPILAIIFKLFRGLLPFNFQYFGLFTLACYIAQAIVGARIFRRFTTNGIFSFCASVLLLFCPVLLHRTFVHEALSAQFLILFMIETLLLSKSLPARKLYIRIGICSLLAAGIHMYLVLMCGIVLVGCLMYLILDRKYIRACLSLFIYISVAAVTVWIEGGFSSGVTTANSKMYELFGANLNTLYNPCDKSSFIDELPLYTWAENDACAYLGLGVIAACVIMLIYIIINRINFKRLFISNIKLFTAIFTSIVIAFLFAVIPSVTFNDSQLFYIDLPDRITNILSTFRCHGRTMIIVTYFIIVIVPIVIYKCSKRIINVVIIIIALLIQIADISGYIEYKYDFVNYRRDDNRLFEEGSKIEAYCMDESVKHVIIYKSLFSYGPEKDLITDVYVWAIGHGKSVNYIYLARDDDAAYEKRLEEALSNPTEENLYVFSLQDEALLRQAGLYSVISGDYILGRSIPFNL